MANEQVNVTLNIQAKVDEAVSGAKKITDELSKINLPDSVKSKITKTFSDIEKTAGKVGEALTSGFKQKGDVTAYNKNMERLDTLFKQLQKDIGGIDLDVFKKSFNFDTKPIEEAKTKLAEMQAQLQQQKGAAGLESVTAAIKALNSVSDAKSISKYAEALKNLDPQGMAAALRGLELGYSKINQETTEGEQKAKTYRIALDEMKRGYDAIAANPAMSELNRQIEELRVEIEQIKADEAERFATALQDAANTNINNVAEGINKTKKSMEGLPEKTLEFNNQLNQIKNKITHFFGLANGVQLFKRAVTSAFETVKELDKVMTETAVVTDFSVGDMWSQLPEHTKRANELGVSIKGLYEAETIYYQQGLKTNEVQAVSNATLRMARIAGLDAADATDRMTNALRGFNMEINETNADKVADVYSKLAAMSASNVDEISTAMTKVASLASSANMSFENTAAFLSQIVETTRERAETAGTALKTIIARFTEVKELYNQGQFTGVDGEGEAIEVNKVATALKTAGINMNEFFAGTKGLDQIFMELASKWDSLDAVQQRYIATMAAGSRQQSRFIAMMSDYKRTQELTAAANNASGASNEQYEKTLESIETSLTRLKNAWDEFLMGLANNEVLKGAVDVLTWIVNALNSVIGALSGGNGLAKALITAAGAFAAFKMGSKILNGKNGILNRLLGKTADKDAEKKGQGLAKSLSDKFAKTIQQKRLTKMPIFDAKKVGEQAAADLEKNIGGQLDKMAIPPEVKNKINAQLTYDPSINLDQINQQLQPFGQQIQLTQEQMEGLGESIRSTTQEQQNMVNTAGSWATGIGVAVGAIMNLVASFLKTKKASKSVTQGLSTAGTALMALIPIAVQVGSSLFAAGVIGQAGWWWIIIIVAAVALLIGLVVGLAEAAKENSLENKMKEAAEQTDRAKASAEAAQQAYDDLLSSHSDYDKLQEELEGLRKGTDEWKKKLMEVNSEVLNLIAEYPELAKYMSIGKDGQLTISDEGWSALETEQAAAVKRSQAAVVSAQIREEELKQEKAARDMYQNDKIKTKNRDPIEYIATGAVDVWNWVTGNYDASAAHQRRRDVMDSVAEAYIDDNGNVNSELFRTDAAGNFVSEELTRLAEAFGYTANEIGAMAAEIQDYAMTVYNSNETEKALNKAKMTAMASETVSQHEYADQITSIFGEGITKGEKYQKDVSDEEAKLQKEYKNKSEDEVRKAYAKQMGIKVEDVDEDMSKEEMLRAMASSTVDEKYAKNMDTFTKKLNTLSDKQQKQMLGALNGDGSMLSFAELSDIGSLEDYASAMGYSVEEMANALGMSVDELTNQWNDGINDLTTQWNDAAEAFKSKDIDITLYENLDIEVASMVSKQIEGMSEDDAKAYVEAFNSLLEGQSKEQQKVIADYLSGIDLTDSQAKAEALDFLRSMGLEEDKIMSYWEAASNGVQAYTHSVADAYRGQSNLLNKLKEIKDFKEKASSGTLTQQDIQQYIDSGELTAEDLILTVGEDGTLTYGISSKKAEELTSNQMPNKKELQGTYQENVDKLNQSKKDQKNYEKLKKTVDRDTDSYFNDPSAILTNPDNSTDAKKRRAEEYAKSHGLKTMEEHNNFVAQTGLGERYESDEQYIEDMAQRARAEDVQNEAARLGIDLSQFGSTIDEQVEGFLNAYGELPNEIATAEEAVRVAQENLTIVSLDDDVRQTMLSAADTQMVASSGYRDLQKAGVTDVDIQDSGDRLAENYDISKRAAYGVVAANALIDKGVQELAEGYSKWSAEIEQGPGSPGYNAALDNLKKSVTKLVGPIDDLGEEWLTNADNMELFKRVSEGDLEALKELEREIAKEHMLKMDIDEDTVNKIYDQMELLQNEDLEFGATIDDSQYAQQLLDMMLNAGMTADQIAESFGDIGWVPDIEYEEMSLAEAKKIHANTTFEYVDPATGETRTASSETNEASDADTMVKIPVIKGKDGAPDQHFTTMKDAYTSGLKFTGDVKNKVKSSTLDAAKKNKGGGGDKKKNWTNPYDELYNLEKKINEQIRIREKLERKYDKLLENRKASSKDILKAAAAQYKALEKEKKLQEEMLAGRKKQLQNISSRTYEDSDGNRKTYKELGVTKYASITENGLIQIDWDAINKVKDEETGKAIEAYIKELEEIYGKVEDAEKALDEIEDKLEDFRKKSIEQYLAFEERIVQALVQQQQNYIDDLQKISDKISEQNEKVISNLQESVDLERQIRDNTKTEEDIEKKEQRLAYLRRDTSGANQTEILQLEKELKEARESYQDTLTDQAIQKLSDDNAKAQEAREKMIQVLQDQLDWDQKHGTFGPEAERMAQEIAEAKDKGLEALMETEGVKLLQSVDGYEGKTFAGRLAWWNELLLDSNSILEGFNNTLLDIAWLLGTQIKVYDENTGKYITLTPGEKEGSWVDKNGKEYKPFGQNTDFVEHTSDWIIPKDQEESKTEQKTTETESETARSYFDKAGDNPWGDRSKKSKIENFQRGLNILLGKIDPSFKPLTIDGVYGPDTKAAAKKAQKAFGMSSKEADGLWGPKTTTAYHNSKYKAYKTGGLVDFTGPAWLDGSKSKPELVLNSRDTKSFLALKDVLSSFMHSAHSTQPQNMGDLNFDIKVDANIDSDYSVDEMLDRIKQQIVNDASYRNINVLNWIR